MKRKLIVAIPILAVIALLLLILFLTRDKEQDREKLLADSGYPVSLAEDGEKLKVNLDGSKTEDLTWNVKVENTDMLSVSRQGEEKKGKAGFLISPNIAGLTNVIFTRSGDVAGQELTVAEIELPVIVYEEEGRLVARAAEEAVVKEAKDVGGSALEYPYILENHEDGTADISFPKGEADWVFLDPDGIVGTNDNVGADGKSVRSVYRKSVTSSDQGSAVTTEAGSNEASTGEAAQAEGNTGAVDMDGYRLVMTTGDDGRQHVELVKGEATEAEAPDYYDIQVEKYKGHSSVAEDGTVSTLLLAISQSQDVTEFIDVKISAAGSITISSGTEPKQ